MRKKFITLTALLWVGFCSAQIPFDTDEIIEADGITFEVQRMQVLSVIYNTENTYLDQSPWRYKNGEELTTEDEYLSVEASISTAQEYKAIREAFGDDLIIALRAYNHSQMRICYAVSPEGKPLEVGFIMNALPELNELPLTTFATLERKLKAYVTWDINDFAKKLEFFHTTSFISFRNVPTESELIKKRPDLEFDVGTDDLLKP